MEQRSLERNMSSSVVHLQPPGAPEDRSPPRRSRRKTAMDDQKRSFLRMVSHELRTPLNSIIGFSEILSGELCGPLGAPQYKAYAEHVRQSGHKLLRLVNQVLEIARLEGHVTDLDICVEPLDHVFDDVQATLREEISARQVKVIVETDGHSPSVLADPRGLRTVLGNILQNAVTFSPQGGEVRINVELTSRNAEISISDQGEGIPKGDAARLLRPFQQGENTLTRTSEGAGLGLPIAQLYCSAMGGALRLESRPGNGLTAIISLKRAV